MHPSLTVEQQLQQFCEQEKAKLPIIIDSETRLDTITAGPGPLVRYGYALIRDTDGRYSAEQLNSAMRPRLIQNYRTLPGLKTFRDNGVSMIYDYSDAEGTHIAQITVSSDDLK